MKRLVSAFVVSLSAMVFVPGVVRAHTDFDFSLPTQDASVAEPISEITVGFTEPVTLVGNGFEVLNPQGEVVLPTPITDDDTVFRLVLDPPVAGGEVGVRYEVTSVDGHVVSGGFSFTVDAPLPTTTTAAPATTIAPTTPEPPATTVPAPVDTTAPVTVAPAVTAAPSTVPEDESGSNTGLVLAIAAAVVIGATGFVIVRGRSGGRPSS